MPPEKTDKSSRVLIIIAIIGLTGTISAAFIANIDKWWPKTTNDRKAGSSNANDAAHDGNSVGSKNDNSASGDKKLIDKTVALMDNNLLTYDKVRGKMGRTNKVEIEDALNGMGLKFIPVDTYLNWNEYAKLNDAKPALIIIHVSAFYDKTDPKDKANSFRTFLQQAMPALPDTKLLVYSRAFQDVTTSDVDKYASAVPNLKERITFFLVKPGPNRDYFHNMETAGKLRGVVKKMLALP